MVRLFGFGGVVWGKCGCRCLDQVIFVNGFDNRGG